MQKKNWVIVEKIQKICRKIKKNKKESLEN